MGYLNILKNSVYLSKLLFDVDYNWNVTDENGSIDYAHIYRMSGVWKDQDLDNILSNNSLTFFNRLSLDNDLKKLKRRL